jgi:hypothetical protein
MADQPQYPPQQRQYPPQYQQQYQQPYQQPYPPQYQYPPQGYPPQQPPKKKGMGGCMKGCLIFLIVGVFLLCALTGVAYFSRNWIFGKIADFVTDKMEEQIDASNLPKVEKKDAKIVIQGIKEGMKEDKFKQEHKDRLNKLAEKFNNAMSDKVITIGELRPILDEAKSILDDAGISTKGFSDPSERTQYDIDVNKKPTDVAPEDGPQ